MALGSFIMGGAVDPYDEGLHFLSGALYRAGRVPYVDFYPLFPPIWTYAHIMVEAVFGPLLLAQRLWFVAQGFAVIIVCYILLRRVVSSRAISLFAITMIAISGINPFWLPRWSGARLAVYILFWFLYRRHAEGPGQGRGLRLFSLGLFVGLSNLYALDVGIHLTVAGVFMLAVELPRVVRAGKDELKHAARGLIMCSAGFFLPLFIWGAYLAANNALADYLATYYYYYIVLLMPISAKILSGDKIVFMNEKVIFLIIFNAFLAVGGLYLLLSGWFRDNGQVRGVPLLAMALSFIASVSTIRGVDGAQYQMFAFIPMLLWLAYGLDRAAGALRSRGFFSTGSRAADGVRISAGGLMVFLVFAAMFTFYTGTAKDRLRALRSNINICRVAFSGRAWPPGAFSATPALRWTFDASLDPVAAYLNSHTSPGESVLAFPMYAEMIPALAGRHSATRYPVPILVMGSLEGQRAYIEDIERERPRYMVFFPDARFGGKDPVEPYFKTVYSYLTASYEPVPGFSNAGAPQIWARTD